MPPSQFTPFLPPDRPNPGRPGFALPDFDENPFLVIWEATRACALACKHCRAEAHPLPDPAQLDAKACELLIDQVAEAAPSLFVITGGDPMCRPDLLHLIRTASGRGLRVCLSPSATPRLMRTDFETLRGAGVAGMSLSLDGPDRASHDAFRGVPGTWDRSMEILRRAKQADIPVQINTTIDAGNIGKFTAFSELMGELQPSTWSIFLLVPMGRATRSQLPDARDVETFFENLAVLSDSVPFRIKTTDGQHFRRVLLQRSSHQKARSALLSPTTNAGRGFAFISHTGEIFPSGFLPISAGNIRKNRLLDVYRSHVLFKTLRKSAALKGKCGRCEFNDVCGGSRARAYAMSRDMMAADPLCAYQPN